MQNHFTPENGGLDPLPCNTGVHRTNTGSRTYNSLPPWRLDWLRLSFPDSYLDELLSEFHRASLTSIPAKSKHGFAFGIGFVFDMLSTTPDFRIWYGGESQNGRALLDVPAAAAQRVYELVRRLGIPFALNRADMALDFDGVSFLTLQDAILHVWESQWPYKGTKPRPYKIDDMGQQTGSTLYLGRRDSECMVRLYEKGKQMRDTTRPDWVRFEVELKPRPDPRKGDLPRLVAWHMLKDGRFHDIACMGFSAALIPAIWDCAADRVFVHVPKSDRDYEDRLLILVRQYGGLFGEIVNREDGDWSRLGEVIRSVMIENQRRKDAASLRLSPDDSLPIPF